MAMGRGRFAGRVRRLREHTLAELHTLFGPWVCVGPGFGGPKRRRLCFPSRTFWLFLSQVFSADGSCRAAVRKFLAWLAVHDGVAASPNTAAYCKARGRLSEALLARRLRRVTRRVEARAAGEGLWCGRRVKVADGSGLSMADTAENQAVYPQSSRQKPGCGFPAMRIVALFSLATGTLLALAKDRLRVHERTLFRRLWNHLEPGDVVLADRGFCGYADYCCLAERGVECVMRKNGRRSVGATPGRRLGKGDRLIHWHKTGRCPKWLDRQAWHAMPDRLTVREVHFVVDIHGFRTEAITVSTTLLDPQAYPTDAFIELYRRRWMAELFLRDIKTTLGMDILSCKTPDMVHKELLIYLIAYNLVRALMLEASLRHGVPVHRISFKGTLSTVREWAPILAAASPKRRQGLVDRLIAILARDPLPNRPNRVEPRARKRRPKNYQLLNKPRREFKEIIHRSKYRKPLS